MVEIVCIIFSILFVLYVLHRITGYVKIVRDREKHNGKYK